MKTAEELSGVCSSIYWKYEHGQERQATSMLEQIQLDALTEGRKQGRIEGLKMAYAIADEADGYSVLVAIDVKLEELEKGEI